MYIYRLFYSSIHTGYFYRVSKQKERKEVRLWLMGHLLFWGAGVWWAWQLLGRNDGDGVGGGGGGSGGGDAPGAHQVASVWNLKP